MASSRNKHTLPLGAMRQARHFRIVRAVRETRHSCQYSYVNGHWSGRRADAANFCDAVEQAPWGSTSLSS